MKYLKLLSLFVLLASFTVSCANKTKTASANNPYQSNPYYSNSGSSSTASSAGTGSASYPAYTDDTYSAPANPPAPAPAPVQTYPSYTGGSADPYPSYTGAGNNTPVLPSPEPYTAPQSYPSGGYDTYNSSTPTYSAGGSGNHVVARGENLYRISLRYGTTVSAIQAANGMADTKIFPGQQLVIP